MAKIDKALRKTRTRPNGTTFKIVLLGALICLGVWYLWVRPAGAGLTEATERRDDASSLNTALETEIASFRSGESFTSRELPDAVGPAEELLPLASEQPPGETADRIRELAVGAGLSVASIEFENQYASGGGNTVRADVKLQVEGTPQEIAAWLTTLRTLGQLVTVTSPGMSVSYRGGEATLSAVATVWATNTQSPLADSPPAD